LKIPIAVNEIDTRVWLGSENRGAIVWALASAIKVKLCILLQNFCLSLSIAVETN